jgi:hypothetical protein
MRNAAQSGNIAHRWVAVMCAQPQLALLECRSVSVLWLSQHTRCLPHTAATAVAKPPVFAGHVLVAHMRICVVCPALRYANNQHLACALMQTQALMPQIEACFRGRLEEAAFSWLPQPLPAELPHPQADKVDTCCRSEAVCVDTVCEGCEGWGSLQRHVTLGMLGSLLLCAHNAGVFACWTPAPTL